MGGVFTSGKVKNSGGSEISYCSGEIGYCSSKIKTMVECVFGFKRSCSDEVGIKITIKDIRLELIYNRSFLNYFTFLKLLKYVNL
ncbi:hypothetical protein Gotur_012904 [Gossypium turneri]